MKILLDESLPLKLRHDFGQDHDVLTVKDKGWLGQKNGILLNLMVEDGFEVFVTVDRNLPYQQNTEKFPIVIIVLCAKDNRLQTLRALIPNVVSRINQGNLEKVIEIV